MIAVEAHRSRSSWPRKKREAPSETKKTPRRSAEVMSHSVPPPSPCERDHPPDDLLNAGVASADVSPPAIRLIGCAHPLRADRVEGCLLLVSERSVEVIHRHAHGPHRLQHGVEPFADSCEPCRRRQRILRLGLARRLEHVRSPGGGALKRVKISVLLIGRPDR